MWGPGSGAQWTPHLPQKLLCSYSELLRGLAWPAGCPRLLAHFPILGRQKGGRVEKGPEWLECGHQGRLFSSWPLLSPWLFLSSPEGLA